MSSLLDQPLPKFIDTTQRIRCPIENKGNLIKSFSCALFTKALKQGNLQIYENCLEFESLINYNITIPLNDIQKIEKRINAYIFDNSIALIVPKGEIFLTSFLKRDMAFDIIDSLKKGNCELSLIDSDQSSQHKESDTSNQRKFSQESLGELQQYLKEENQQQSNQSNHSENKSSFDAKSIQNETISEEVSKKNSNSLDQFEILPTQYVLKAKVEDSMLVEILFLGKPFFYQNKQWSNFFEWLCFQRNDSNLKIVHGQKTENQQKLQIFYDHPVKAPTWKISKIEENVTIHKIDIGYFIEIEVFTSGVMLSDTFKIIKQWIIEKEQNLVKVSMSYKVIFLKSSWFQGKIESSVKSDIKEIWEKIYLPNYQNIIDSCLSTNNQNKQNKENEPQKIQNDPIQKEQNEIQQQTTIDQSLDIQKLYQLNNQIHNQIIEIKQNQKYTLMILVLTLAMLFQQILR